MVSPSIILTTLALKSAKVYVLIKKELQLKFFKIHEIYSMTKFNYTFILLLLISANSFSQDFQYLIYERYYNHS